jgi:hypothetical protein
VTPGPRLLNRVLVAAATLGGLAIMSAAPALAGPSLLGEFAPPDGRGTRRGREVAERFELGRRFELTLAVSNAFSDQNRAAVARLESALAALPGVRQVIGPARLQAFTADGAGQVTARPLDARGPRGAADFEHRLSLRPDAAGWFVSPDGAVIRLLLDTDDVEKLRPRIEATVASSGLVLLEGTIPAAPLWPDPERDPVGFAGEGPLALALLMMLVPFLAVTLSGRLAPSRRWSCGAGAAIAAALPGLVAPVAGIRRYAVVLGVSAALALLACGVLFQGLRRLRGRPSNWLPGRAAPLPLIVISAALIGTAVSQGRRLRMETDLWRETPFFFIDVRADIAEPVVLRELRRLTELLRLEPGIDQVWSVADLFGAIPMPSNGLAGIPNERETSFNILQRAASDPAVQLELAAGLQEALIVVRLDRESGLGPARVRARGDEMLRQQLRPTLLRIDVTNGATPFRARSFGRGFLAEDARARVLRLCEEAGRNLEPEQELAITQLLRRVALAPRLDPAVFRAEASREIEAFVEEVSLAGKHVGLPHVTRRQRLIEALLASAGEPSAEETVRALADVWGGRVPPRALQVHATELRRRLAALRRREMVASYSKTILAEADLPTEGGLSDAVRDATLEAMGPIVGVPAAPGAAGAIPVDAAIVGGVVADDTLSAVWPPRLRSALLFAALLLGVALWAVDRRFAALAWVPVGMAPAALVIAIPTILGVATGSLFVAVLSGALAGGTVFALAFAPGRNELP